MAMTKEQALALASARLRLQQQQAQPQAQPEPTQPQAEEPSYLSKVGRSAGITARGGLTGLASIPLALTDLAAYPVNAVSRLMGKGNVLPNYQQSFQQGLSNMGLPEPQGAIENLSMAASSGIGGAGGGIGTGQQLTQSARPIIQGIGNILKSAPASQAIAGGSAATSAEFARQQGAGPVGQTMAGLLGGFGPGMAAQKFLPKSMNPIYTEQLPKNAVLDRTKLPATDKKSAFEGIKPVYDDANVSNLDRTTQYQKSVQILDDAGVELSKGQRSGVDATRAIETTLEKMPILGRPLQNLADKTRLSYQKKLLQMAGNADGDALITRESLERTGNALSKKYAEALKGKKVSIADDEWLDDLGRLEQIHGRLVDDVTKSKVKSIINEFLDEAQKKPYMTGEDYQAQRSLFARKAKGNTEVADLYADLKVSLDNAFRRAAGDKGKLDSQFAQYKQLEDIYNRSGGALASEGFISPIQLSRAASGAPGSTEWKDFTRAAATVIPDRLGQSGTAQRTTIANMAMGTMPAWMFLEPVSGSITGASMLSARGLAGQLAKQPTQVPTYQLESLLFPTLQASQR